tara:strand:- start:1224 stop:1517 length:294 start_codon:yes stop_codon:yes gene_type:complete
MDKGASHRLQKIENDRLNRMTWKEIANVLYYVDPKDKTPHPYCAIIKNGQTTGGVEWGTVYWRGWGVASFELQTLKKDVEQKHRIDTMKIFTYKGGK